MYLKQIDIQGFKSFPEKVRLEFNEGLTAVVGPNGSGKSNVSDAVRWVLGEQRPKSLRGDKMEDVIFAGTEKRKPMGFAEVFLTIDNSDLKLPVDYTEVTVGRRVFRSGESGYFINKTPCRLKDVMELFMDTGVGREGYSIVGQGRIDEILSSKGEDRRRVFEEAAGIVKYKNRRKEAQAKLDKERENLVRVNDIINELKKNLPRLEKQAEEAERYLKLRDRLKDLDINIFAHEGDKNIENIEKAKEKIVINRDSLLDLSTEKEETEKKLNELLALEESILLRIQALNAEIIEKRGEAEKLEGEINLLKSQSEGDAENISRSRAEIARNHEDSQKRQEEISVLKSSLNAYEIEKKTKEEETKGLTAEYEKLLNRLNIKEAETEDKKARLIEKMRELSELKGSFKRYEALLEQFNERSAQVKTDLDYTKSALAAAETAGLALDKRIDEILNNQHAYEENLKAVSDKRAELGKALSAKEQELLSLMRERDKKVSRLKVLSDMERDMEGYQRSVKAILAQGDKGSLKGILGSAADLLSVPEKFERAVETAMGGNLQSIVTENEENAKAALNYLKSNGLGRATFLPVATVKGRENPKLAGIKKTESVFGSAKELVSFNPKYDGIFGYILGQTLVVDSMDTAIRLEREHKQGLRIVTLDGDIINPGGAITGGSRAKAMGILGRRREIEELKREELGAKKEIEAINGEIEKIKEKNALIEEKESELKEILQEVLISKAALDEKKAQNIKGREETARKLELLKLELKQGAVQEESLKARLDGLNEEMAAFESEIASLDASIAKEGGSTAEEKERRDSLLDGITALKLELSALGEKKIAADKSVRTAEAEISANSERISALEEEIAGFEENIKDREEKILGLKNDLEAANAEYRAKQEELSENAAKRDRVKAEHGVLSGRKEELIKNEMLLKNEEVRLNMALEKLETENEKLVSLMWENYEITLREAKEYPALGLGIKDLEKEAKEVKLKLKAFGFVNTAACEELKETKERFEFLSTQAEDIMSAEKKLLGIIDSLTKQMAVQFKEQFALISKNFSQVFAEMFGGGEAYLTLSDDGGVLDAGIEIIAQPPGKKLQNMNLLSGGERALTAISILFAILKLKPSPFCILDEIESALDDANVYKFGEYLKKYSEKTQFIVITHRKGTMEAADRLYGVTMEEKGVSKLISVNFSDKMEV